jgi:HlyD family secretion protein
VEEGLFESRFTATMPADLDQSVDCVQVLVHVGDYVQPGTPVFSIDSKSVRDILNSFEDKVDSQKSSVESAKQKLDSSEENYEKYTITSPVDGVVITKNYKVGDKIGNNSGQNNSSTSLATLYDMSEYNFKMSIDETDIVQIKTGQKVEVSADAFNDKTFQGKVTKISLESSVSNGVSTYPVTVTMENTEDLLPGMNVDAEIIIDSAENALVIPADALMRGTRVYVKDDSVTEAQGAVPKGFRAVKVQTGLVNDEKVEILSDELSEGDVVYVQESTVNTWTGRNGMPGGGGMGGMPGAGGQGGRSGGSGSGGGSRSGGSGSSGGSRR